MVLPLLMLSQFKYKFGELTFQSYNRRFRKAVSREKLNDTRFFILDQAGNIRLVAPDNQQGKKNA